MTYSFYDVWADLYRIPYHTCALDENWHINPEDYKQPNGGVIFPNPNAPTGVEESQELIEEILQANPDVVVIVDEAYVDFGGTSALPLLKNMRIFWWYRLFPNPEPWRECVSASVSVMRS